MLNKTSCLCGKELKGVKFDKYIPMKMNDKFYGGRISMTGDIKCDCGRDLKGYFQRVGNDLSLIDLEVVNDITEEEKIDLKPTSGVDFSEMTYKEVQEYAKSKGIEKVNIKREELIEQLK
jgi:hypothetical protein